MNWEINFGYMPFLYRGQSISHTPDVDINFGAGDRIQLTYENAWLRVHNPSQPVKYGFGQDQLGVKWRFYDSGEEGMALSIFPQASLNNPNHSVQRDIVPPGSSLIEIDLIERNGGTLLRFTHTGLPNAEQVASHGIGWAHYLARLAVAAAGGDPGPDRGPHHPPPAAA